MCMTSSSSNWGDSVTLFGVAGSIKVSKPHPRGGTTRFGIAFQGTEACLRGVGEARCVLECRDKHVRYDERAADRKRGNGSPFFMGADEMLILEPEGS